MSIARLAPCFVAKWWFRGLSTCNSAPVNLVSRDFYRQGTIDNEENCGCKARLITHQCYLEHLTMIEIALLLAFVSRQCSTVEVKRIAGPLDTLFT